MTFVANALAEQFLICSLVSWRGYVGTIQCKLYRYRRADVTRTPRSPQSSARVCELPHPSLSSACSHRATAVVPSFNTTTGVYDGRHSRANRLFGTDLWGLHEWSTKSPAFVTGAHGGEGQSRGRAESSWAGPGFTRGAHEHWPHHLRWLPTQRHRCSSE